MRPNIFDYATSELSQDAFLAWLFKWAEKENEFENKELYKCSNECLKTFFGNIKINKVNTVSISKQWENIDLWITVNEKYHLIIEDKTGTSEHNNQLVRYKDIAKKWYRSEKGKDFDSYFSFVYFKTGDVTPYEKERIDEAEYKIITRSDMLAIFNKYEIKDTLFVDYKMKLQNKEFIQNLTFKKPFHEILKEEDSNEYIKGFYIALQPHLDDAYWEYVNNPSNSFYGMWWYWCKSTYGTLYFQFIEFDLQIRLGEIIRTKDKKTARDKTYNKIISAVEKSNYKGLIVKPDRFGVGESMAIVKVDRSLWLALDENGYLDMEKILQNLHKLEMFLWKDVLNKQ